MAKKQIIQGGKKGVRAAFEDAQRDLAADAKIEDANPNEPRNGIKPGQWPGAPWDNMPPGCPFEVLGQNAGTIYIRSATFDLMEITTIDHQAVMRMCAPFPNYALWAWPGFGKAERDPETGEEKTRVKRLERDRAATCIITEAAKRGTFDRQASVRGRGGWKIDDKLVWHSGANLWTVEVDLDRQTGLAKDWRLKSSPPVSIDGKLYAKSAETIAPWAQPVSDYDTPAHQILQDLGTWSWERPWLDPLLMLGWIGVGFMGAAPKVRPAIGLTGGRGTGKSTLHDYLKALFGPVIYATANTTAAGIYQNIGQDSRPVLIDEFEAKAGSTKEQSIIELMRQSFSGGNLYRGSSDHEGIAFQMYSAFLLSGISLPPLSQQDRSRMALLHLNKLQATGAEPLIKPEWGRMLLRQVMDGWHDLQHHISPKWARILHRAGFDARGIDTYGTLLAVADLMVGSVGFRDIGFAADDEEWTIDALRTATTTELEEQVEKWQDVIERVLSTQIDQWKGGERQTVGGVLELYEKSVLQLEEARASLAVVGLGLRPAGKPGVGPCLAIPHSSPQLERIFQDTDYYKGGWINVLKQAPATVALRTLDERYRTIKINRQAKKCLLVDMRAYDAMTVPEGIEA